MGKQAVLSRFENNNFEQQKAAARLKTPPKEHASCGSVARYLPMLARQSPPIAHGFSYLLHLLIDFYTASTKLLRFFT